MKSKKKTLFHALGPGLITGASDDDPSGIGTYSQAGAAFGFSMLWTMVLTYPLMVVVQATSARIGRTTGRGLAANIRLHYPAWLLHSIVFLLLVANSINIAADLGAMAAALQLVAGGWLHLYLALFALCTVLLEVFVPYTRYVFYLKWLTLSLFAYIATAFAVHIPWGKVLHATFLPHLAGQSGYLKILVGIFGTTISPYLFFWQASEEVEDMNCRAGGKSLLRSPRRAAAGEIDRINFDTSVGMGFSNLVAFFIILTTAVTLHAGGITEIESADQAAKALEPIAGHLASLVFALGIIGTGLLAVPVLAASSAYAVGEALHWKVGLNKTLPQAKRFYAVIVLGTLIGTLITFTSINPMKALVFSAVINGIIAVPILVVMMLMSGNPAVMGKLTVSPWLRSVGWLTALLMGVMALGMAFL